MGFKEANDNPEAKTERSAESSAENAEAKKTAIKDIGNNLEKEKDEVAESRDVPDKNDESEINEKKEIKSLSETAAEDQEDSGGIYVRDTSWKDVNLNDDKDNEYLYNLRNDGAESGSNYYINQKQWEKLQKEEGGEVSAQGYKEKLQIADDNSTKNTVDVYKLETGGKDVAAAKGKAEANKAYGEGGAEQIFIPDSREMRNRDDYPKLVKVDEIKLTDKDDES